MEKKEKSFCGLRKQYNQKEKRLLKKHTRRLLRIFISVTIITNGSLLNCASNQSVWRCR